MEPNRSLRVLIVDDDPADALLTRKLLTRIEGACFDVECVTTPHEALPALQDPRYDLCLLDHRLGAESGLDLFRAARAAGRVVPTLFLTAEAAPDIDAAAMGDGAADYLLKRELNPALLGRAIRHALEREQLLRREREAREAAEALSKRLAATLAAQASVASENARLYEQLQQELQERRHAEEALWENLAERRQAEEALREAVQALEHAVEGIARVDAAGRYESVNAAYAGAVGYAQQDLLGQGWLVTIHTGDHPRLESAYQEMLREGRAEVEALGLRRDGTTFHESLVLVAIRDERDALAGHYCFMKDVTDRHRLESQLLQAQKMEAVGQLAGGVAHDFNNMLAVINGYSELLLETLRADSPIRSHIAEISRAGGRAAELTRQLLAFSRKQILEPRVLDLNQTTQNLGKMLRRLIGEDIELVSLPDPALARIKADPGQIEQVLLNLVVNARDAMPRGGKLVLRTANAELGEAQAAQAGLPAGRYVLLQVQDNGCGISPEILPHIFEPFFTTKELGKGTGLGLATVYGIVKQSGGAVQVESAPGAGTTVSIYLPRAVEVPAEDDAMQPLKLPSGSETILVVEDEPLVRSMVCMILAQCGYTVLEAIQGDDALQLLETRTGPLHLLLTDVVMPRMSGRELAQKVRSKRPETQVLFMSGYTDDAVLRHGVSDAEVELIQKPFTPLALAQRVRRILDAARVSRGRVLLVEDDALQRETLQELLGGQGYEVWTARDGAEAFQVLRGGRLPDVILLDLMMPGMNGWVFRLEQQNDPALRHIPVVVVSGKHDSRGVQDFLRPAGYLPKPLDVHALLQTLAAFCTPVTATESGVR